MSEDAQALLGAVILTVVLALVSGVYSLIEGLLQTLGLSWNALPLLLAVGVVGLFYLKWAVTHPREAALVLSAPLWLPHFVAAWLVLWVGRGKVVRRWAYQTDREREVVRVWLRNIPGFLGVIWFALIGSIVLSLGWLLPAQPAGWTGAMLSFFTASFSSLLWVYCYYRIYFEHPPHSPDWAMFAGVHREMLLEKNLAGITAKTRRKLGWAKWKNKLWRG